MADEKQKSNIWEVVKAISTVLVVIVVCVKVYLTPMALTVDFPTLLSLLLALFSVALAALFYFKATETSNTFYDNTYKFTRDIAQLLAKMESGFGERLKHLDEGYSSLRSSFQGGTQHSASENVETTKQKLEEEQQEVRKVMEDRNRIVRDLIERSQLQKEQKEQVTAQLKSKEEELLQMQREVEKLNRRLAMERLRRRRELSEGGPDDVGMHHYTRTNVIEKIGRERVLESSPSTIRRLFGRLVDDLPRGYIADLERLGYFDGNLTGNGAEYLRTMARRDDA
ncbi:hypothetical protein GALL_337020 [mine drainage metagenome]|uniref:Uncharacterized protein n=1 Tax=mine drainage metagenome TaxID=410659 RepID=A0A1J5QXB1_9ZZZZ